jgi:hypothetical protein
LQTSEKLIQQAIDEGWINSLAFYYFLKKRVVNSTIYGSRLKTVVEKTGSSYRTCKKHLNILYKKGLIVKHGGNFTLIAQRKAAQCKHLCTFKFTEEATLKEVKALLYAKIVEMKCRQQRYVYQIKADQRLRGINHGEKPSETVQFSDSTLSNYLGLSRGTVQSIKKFWRSQGIFALVTPKPEFVCFVGVNICDIPGMFTYRGRLYKAHATRYIPLWYPITA